MKMIRLIYDSFDEPSSVELQERKDSKTNAPSSTSLINPLVIGISVFCGVLLTALVVVWLLYKRKGRQNQPVQATSQAVASTNIHGTEV